jgi:NAD(P)H-nitrite reductase large subunit
VVKNRSHDSAFVHITSAMNNTYPDSKEDRICACSGTTIGQIKRLIDKGIVDMEAISRATGACSGCGACDTDILALLAEYSVPVSPRPMTG